MYIYKVNQSQNEYIHLENEQGLMKIKQTSERKPIRII